MDSISMLRKMQLVSDAQCATWSACAHDSPSSNAGPGRHAAALRALLSWLKAVCSRMLHRQRAADASFVYVAWHPAPHCPYLHVLAQRRTVNLRKARQCTCTRRQISQPHAMWCRQQQALVCCWPHHTRFGCWPSRGQAWNAGQREVMVKLRISGVPGRQQQQAPTRLLSICISCSRIASTTSSMFLVPLATSMAWEARSCVEHNPRRQGTMVCD